MKKLSILLFSCLTITLSAFAQNPQFAVVRPNGTTYICPSWDSAYIKSQDGDNIYLPGVALTQNLIINKRLQIYGAGHHPDSSQATGKTTINGSIGFNHMGNGSYLEGIQTLQDLFFSPTNRQVKNITINRCRVRGWLYFGGINIIPDSLPTNIGVTECIVSFVYGSNSTATAATNNNFVKNIIEVGISGVSNSSFSNNIFLSPNEAFSGLCTNNMFQNNIFFSASPFYGANPCDNTFFNNVKVGSAPFGNCGANGGLEVNTMAISTVADALVSYSSSAPYYNNDYHLKPTCIGKNAGTDGTDVGIYGTNRPTAEGWVPSNPHIYFKQVDTQSGSDGKLKVQYKVRTNN